MRILKYYKLYVGFVELAERLFKTKKVSPTQEVKMKEEKPTIEEKNKAGEKRTILEDCIEIREICTDLNFEIDIPDSVLAALNVNSEKDMVRFVEENGKVYIEKVQRE